MLRQSDGYLSGQQLCDHFQVSRTAVWKAINQLKEYISNVLRDLPEEISDYVVVIG